MNRLVMIFLTYSLSLPVLADKNFADDRYQDNYYTNGDYSDNYYKRPVKKRKSKKTTPFNNWNNSIRRWSRGEGAWDNWRDWKGSNNNQPWNMFGDAMGDMTADMMGDVVADIDFEIWLEINFEADMWFDMDQQDQFDIYKFWQQKVEPHYDYYNYNDYQSDYQQHGEGYSGDGYYNFSDYGQPNY